MSHISISRQVNADVETTFAVYTDFRRGPEYIPGIKRLEILTPDPTGVGTRFRETRVMFNREATEEMEITAFEPNRLVRIEAESCGARYVSDFTFQPTDRGTEVTLTMQVRPLTLFARLLSPLAWCMMGPIKKALGEDLECMAKVAEAKSAV